MCLAPHHLDAPPFPALAVPLTVKHPLPGAEIELSLRDRYQHLVADRQAPEVRRRVVFTGLVVPVAARAPRRDRPLQPFEDVLPQPRLMVVHEHRRRDVHGAHEDEAFPHAALPHLLGHRVADVDDLLPRLGVEPHVVSVRLHWCSPLPVLGCVELSHGRSSPRLRLNMALPFRQRIFLILVALTATPTTLAVIGWALSVRSAGPSAGALASLEEVGNSARTLAERVDTLRLSPGQRAAVRQHFAQGSNAVTLARRAARYLRYYTAGLAVLSLRLGGPGGFASVRLAGHLSRQLSPPIDRPGGWARRVWRRGPPPAGGAARGAPAFEAVRQGRRAAAGAPGPP